MNIDEATWAAIQSTLKDEMTEWIDNCKLPYKEAARARTFAWGAIHKTMMMCSGFECHYCGK
jgi:hypothetical protein